MSRLQTGTDICKETYEKIKGELKNPVEEYALFWPEQKVNVVAFRMAKIKQQSQLFTLIHLPLSQWFGKIHVDRYTSVKM